MNKVLMVEDDAVVQRVYRGLLEREGFEVHTVSDGAQVMNRLSQVQPNAVLLDVMLPHGNGVELLRQIRGMEAYANLPICILTNAFVDSFVTKAKEAGATAIFDKATTPPRHVIDRFVAALGNPNV